MAILAAFFEGHTQDQLTWHASGNGGVVAAGPEESAQAGLDILSRGAMQLMVLLLSYSIMLYLITGCFL
ncbi:MAG: hypothetical protein PHG29_04720 [Prolixibacteraceae bacterium]|nr:hypothetical protein [Prolixibacteraceae bacterium]